MTDRLEIASRVLARMVHEYNGPDGYAAAARESLSFADALIAAHEATAKPAEVKVLPEDAPVMEWEVTVIHASGSGGHWAIADSFDAEGRSELSAPMRLLKADADLPTVRAAAVAYSAAKGCRAVFVEEGCKDA